MDYTKAEILDRLRRQEISYRAALLSSDWLRDTARFSPSAVDHARGAHFQFKDNEWVSCADIADKLTRDPYSLASDFVLTQLHSLIRVPFELLKDYCEGFDAAAPEAELMLRLKAMRWYEFARLIRNAISHNFRFDFKAYDRRILPVVWNEITLSDDLDGKDMTYDFWHRPGYLLFLEMQGFAEVLPELPHKS